MSEDPESMQILRASAYGANQSLCTSVARLMGTWATITPPDQEFTDEVLEVFRKMVRGEKLPTPAQAEHQWHPYRAGGGAYGPRRGDHIRIALGAAHGDDSSRGQQLAALRGAEGKVVDVRRGSVVVLLSQHAKSGPLHLASEMLERRA